MGRIAAVCTSEKKGTQKKNAGCGKLIADWGLEGDAHAGKWHRQVSLLSLEKIEAFRKQGADVEFGAFGENIVVDGIDFATLPVGTIFCTGSAVLELTQIGKECHSHCEIFKVMGDCIMPREGVFARVISGGKISAGDAFNTAKRYRAAIITASDKGAQGLREDSAGAVIKEIIAHNGYDLASYKILPDEQHLIEEELKRLADSHIADLILTDGGTGLSPRDRTPEATLAVAQMLVPGIPEAMRGFSLNITKRAMFSRSQAVVRGGSLIINLPGSKKAVEETLGFLISDLRHALDILSGADGECGRL
jgi:molybdenum cofactor synthesis domain-containing protein